MVGGEKLRERVCHDLVPIVDLAGPEPGQDEVRPGGERDDHVRARPQISDCRDGVEIVCEAGSSLIDETGKTEDVAIALEVEDRVIALIDGDVEAERIGTASTHELVIA